MTGRQLWPIGGVASLLDASKGEWDTDTDYVPGDMVTYQGSTWILGATTRGVYTTHVAGWDVISLSGTDQSGDGHFGVGHAAFTTVGTDTAGGTTYWSGTAGGPNERQAGLVSGNWSPGYAAAGFDVPTSEWHGHDYLVGLLVTSGGVTMIDYLLGAGAPGDDAAWTVFAAASLVIVQHGSDATVARPDTVAVYWIGDVEPDNMTDADIWNGPA